MGLERRSEPLLDAHVQLCFPEREPAAAAHRQQRRLLDLVQSEQLPVEPARLLLALDGRRDLDVVEPCDAPHKEARPSYSGFGFAPTARKVTPASPPTTTRVESASTLT